MNDKSLDWIQMLRGIAALLVVLCHGRVYLSDTPGFQNVQEALLPGAMGVDLFFIISGFIMVYSTKSADGTPNYTKKFAIKRFSRIWPVYAIATIFWLIVTNRFIPYFTDMALSTEFLKSIFFIPINTSRGLFFEPSLQLGWTLDFEMYFYLIFTLALLFGKFRTLAVCIWAGVTVILIPCLTRVFSIDPLQTYAYSFSYANLVTSPIILEFVAGCIIAEIYLQPKIKFRSSIVALNIAAVSVAIAVWRNYSETGVYHGIGHWGGPLALMVLCLALCSKTVAIPTPRLLVWIGQISFSLYLIHLSVRVVADNVVVHFGDLQLMHTWTYIALTTTLSIAAAAVCYRYLEQGLSEKLRNALIRLFTKHGQISASHLRQDTALNHNQQPNARN